MRRSIALFGLIAVGCGGPSKSAALDAIVHDVVEDPNCTLSAELMRGLKMQYTSKGVCVPNDDTGAAGRCIDALVAAGVTHTEPASYMVQWAEVPSVTSVYDQHARNIVYKTCVEMSGHLREGGFDCAEVHADKVLHVLKVDDTHATVEYARTITLKPSLAAIEVACGVTSHPPVESSATFVKGESGWALTPAAPH